MSGSPSRRIFEELLRRRLEGCADIKILEIAEVGWPEEVTTIKSAKNRVYALSTLRNAGLKDILQTTKTGYRLGLVREQKAIPLYIIQI